MFRVFHRTLEKRLETLSSLFFGISILNFYSLSISLFLSLYIYINTKLFLILAQGFCRFFHFCKSKTISKSQSFNTMTSVVEIDGQQLVNALQPLSIQDRDDHDRDQSQMQRKKEIEEKGFENHGGICAVCLNRIVLEETALVKGCEHAYCVTCILRWASYREKATCPQCKHPFEFLNVHRALDGSINDYMFEESVCLLLRATWFKPLIVEDREDSFDDPEEYYPYEDEEDDLDEVYFSSSSSIRIGNRRWGDNGFVRGGRQEARPVHRSNYQDPGASSSREPRRKEPVKAPTGRRAKRALKREAADKAAAEKHQQHLVRLGRK